MVAYQFNPLENVSVLERRRCLPREALTYPGEVEAAYVVAGWPQTIAHSDNPDTTLTERSHRAPGIPDDCGNGGK